MRLSTSLLWSKVRKPQSKSVLVYPWAVVNLFPMVNHHSNENQELLTTKHTRSHNVEAFTIAFAARVGYILTGGRAEVYLEFCHLFYNTTRCSYGIIAKFVHIEPERSWNFISASTKMGLRSNMPWQDRRLQRPAVQASGTDQFSLGLSHDQFPLSCLYTCF